MLNLFFDQKLVKNSMTLEKNIEQVWHAFTFRA